MIELKKLSFSYESKEILKELSLKIQEGDFLAVIGHNGSGKTTFIKHINGLLLPETGEVLVDGLCTKDDGPELRNKIAMVFQNPEDQLVYSIVEEDVAFGLENAGVQPAEMKKRVANILKELNIPQLAKENVNSLSFGQKQLVALAGALVIKPKYLILDEPTTNLDPKNRANILSILTKINKDGISILLVTNNLADVQYAKNVLLLKKGEILFYGLKEKLTSQMIAEAGINE
ncbi:ATP-binding cassette domain-containing protein [Candidatus Woesearchaeota archaeon]|nr:ATP-binding cassette domain-containing protein [Candidatus Woesearchaeota archaeon]